jgi:headcase protein
LQFFVVDTPNFLAKKTFLTVSFSLQIEDEGKHGNDDTRMFVLSSLAAHKKTHMTCISCKEMMLVYDRYPLVDGTFFLSPIQHSKDCIEVSKP